MPVQAQANALMEVSAGTSDAAVIDVLMAAEMTGEGTSYADLIYSLNLNEAQDLPSEEYGVGFRQGSDLVDAFNTFLAEKTADGTVLEVKNSIMVSSSQGQCGRGGKPPKSRARNAHSAFGRSAGEEAHSRITASCRP